MYEDQLIKSNKSSNIQKVEQQLEPQFLHMIMEQQGVGEKEKVDVEELSKML
jgi:hypothetical protein